MATAGQLATSAAETSSAVLQARVLAVAQPFLQKRLLWEMGACLSPLVPAFWLNQPALGSRAFLAILVIILGIHAVRNQPFEFLCLLVGVAPALVIIRGIFIPFSSVLALLALGVSWLFWCSSSFEGVLKRSMILWLITGSLFYWIASFAATRVYSNNMRVLEWAFAATVVFMLSHKRSYLSTALVGWGFSVVVAGTMLLPYGDRLGMATFDGLNMGNPILLGIPAALIVMLSVAEQGRWLVLQASPILRVILGVSNGIFLILSTSRGSWAVAAIGLVVLALLDRRARGPMLLLVLFMSIGVLALLNVPRMSYASDYLLKIFSSDKTLEQKTSGRADQWRAFPEVLAASPVWGFGPGNGRAASRLFAGENLVWHSLYLQIGAETGIVGLTVLAVFLGTLVYDGLRHFQTSREIVPLLGTVTFMVIGLSVSAFDSLGGFCVGLGLVGASTTNLWRIKGQSSFLIQRSGR